MCITWPTWSLLPSVTLTCLSGFKQTHCICLLCPNVYWINVNFVHSCYCVHLYCHVYGARTCKNCRTAQNILCSAQIFWEFVLKLPDRQSWSSVYTGLPNQVQTRWQIKTQTDKQISSCKLYHWHVWRFKVIMLFPLLNNLPLDIRASPSLMLYKRWLCKVLFVFSNLSAV